MCTLVSQLNPVHELMGHPVFINSSPFTVVVVFVVAGAAAAAASETMACMASSAGSTSSTAGILSISMKR